MKEELVSNLVGLSKELLATADDHLLASLRVVSEGEVLFVFLDTGQDLLLLSLQSGFGGHWMTWTEWTGGWHRIDQDLATEITLFSFSRRS